MGKTGWAILGFAAGVMATILAGVALAALQSQPSSRTNVYAEWSKTWPTLNFPGRTATPPPGVTVEYDKFKDYTTIRQTVTLNGVVNLRLVRTCLGNKMFDAEPDRTVSIGCPEEANEMIYLADGERIVGENIHGSVYEIPTEAFLRICAAKNVELSLKYSSGYRLTASDLAKFRDFASMMKE